MEKVTLGGDRIGAGNKNKVEMHGFSRSNHDRGYLWRSTMSAGTLVPFMKQVMTPGTTFDIDLDAHVLTLPTVGPLFGSFKLQLEIYQCPVRLYQGKLHNNTLNIGMRMQDIKLPIIELTAKTIGGGDDTTNIDQYQINPSCILSYLGIRGVGLVTEEEETRTFNALPLLMYWDIVKNYHINKQEEECAVIHTPAQALVEEVTAVTVSANVIPAFPAVNAISLVDGSTIVISKTSGVPQPLNQVILNTSYGPLAGSEIGEVINETLTTYEIAYNFGRYGARQILNWYYADSRSLPAAPITIQRFATSELDAMREAILAHTQSALPFKVNDSAGAPDTALAPYSYLLLSDTFASMEQSQEGLALKTYQSDLFNNWLSTEWIDGVNGISEVTKVDTSDGSFTIDALTFSRKLYDMLNRIMVTGGSYQDWQQASYDHKGFWAASSPMYEGGLIKELIFQEVVSNTESPANQQGVQPLGTLAGRGRLNSGGKGGKIRVSANELSYLIGIVSLTPRIDYSQGNDWDMHLESINDFHKPGMDEIGFQELLIEQMAWWSTYYDVDTSEWKTRSAGKQPAWINYMTNVNKTYGDFAIDTNSMFMTLNRRYTPAWNGDILDIDDLTTYIDPAKYNNIFAQTALDSQNFWVQISVDIRARQKQSARLMPNL